MTDEPPGGVAEAGARRRPRLPKPTGRTSLDLAAGGLVLAAYLVLQLVFLQGPHPYDPSRYFTTAVDFPNVPVDLWTLRIGLVAPVRAAVLLLGPSEAALYAVPVAAGLLLAAAVFGTMLLLFGDRVVAAAAALVAVLNTSFLLNSSFIFPDTVATATFAAGFFFLVLGGAWAERRPASRLPVAAALAAGVLFGWSYLVREFSPVLLPVVVAAVLLLRYSWRRVVAVAGAALATASLELLYGFLRYEKPLVHLEALLSRRDRPFGQTGRASRAEHIQGQLDSPLDTILVFPRLVLAWDAGWILLILVALLVVSLAWLRDRRLWLLATWCFGFWLVMAVLGLWTLPSGRWLLNVTNIRYWYPIFPALAMGAFGGLYVVVRRLLPTARGLLVAEVAAASLALVALVPGFVEFDRCAAANVWRNDPRERWHELRAWLAAPEAGRYERILTDRVTARVLDPVYTRTTFGRRVWEGSVRRLPDAPSAVAAGGGSERLLVLVDGFRFRGLPEAESRLIALRDDGWSPVFVSADRGLILLASGAVSSAGTASAGVWWDLPQGPKSRGRECGQSPYERSG